MISCVIQGGIRPETEEVVNNYLASGLFDKVIFSGRTDQAWMAIPQGVTRVFSDAPQNCGVGNRNIQITSTRAGLSQVETPFVWKVRSDQILPVSTLHQINEFINRDKWSSDQMFVAGNYRRFPFHPRDHIFIGPTTKIQDVFNIPLDYVSLSTDYTKYTRAETWIGANYLAKYNKHVKYMLQHYHNYLVDDAPELLYALSLSAELTPKAFQALPRIEFSWPKHGLNSYHYHVGESLSEYWSEE
jgi:hypothetical protein